MADYLNVKEYWAKTYWGGAYWGKVTTIVLIPTPVCRTFVVYVSKCPIGHRTSTIRIVSFDNSRESIAVPAPQGQQPPCGRTYIIDND